MKPKLTRKQRGFVKDYIKSGNGTEAALKNYDIESDKPEKVASVIAAENLAKPSIINAIHAALPDELLAQVHLEGLKATRQQGVGGMVLDTEKGEFGHTNIEVPDYSVRHKYLDSAYKLKGLYAPDKAVTLSLTASSEELTTVAKEFDEWYKHQTSGH